MASKFHLRRFSRGICAKRGREHQVALLGFGYDGRRHPGRTSANIHACVKWGARDQAGAAPGAGLKSPRGSVK